MITYTDNELVASSKIVKNFGSYLSKLKDGTTKKLAILKNNKIEAILISKSEYEELKEANKKYQLEELKRSIDGSLKEIEARQTYPIEDLWDMLDD